MKPDELKKNLIALIREMEDPILLKKLWLLVQSEADYDFLEENGDQVEDLETLYRDEVTGKSVFAKNWEDLPKETQEAITRGIEESKDPKNLKSLEEFRKEVEQWGNE